MRMKITTLTITLVLLVSFVTSSAQPLQERYYIVTLKGSVVKNVLINPAFSYFDFTFKPLGNYTYSLQGYAKNKDSNTIGGLITLAPMTSKPTRPLNNLEKGHLYLSLETMQANNVDGSEDYILTPKKTKDKSGNLVDYVSYRFSNKIESAPTGFLSNAITAFDLNPSPPY